MTVVLRLKSVTAIQDDSHPIVLALCDRLLWLCAHLRQARWTARSIDDCSSRLTQLVGAERPAGMEGDQPAGHAGRPRLVDRDAGVDGAKPSLLADLDGGSAISDGRIAPGDFDRAGIRAKKLCGACDGLGDPVSPFDGGRNRARPARFIAARPPIAYGTHIRFLSLPSCRRSRLPVAGSCLNRASPRSIPQ